MQINQEKKLLTGNEITVNKDKANSVTINIYYRTKNAGNLLLDLKKQIKALSNYEF
jgi:hypothetical protein